jgi:hypothetical protein
VPVVTVAAFLEHVYETEGWSVFEADHVTAPIDHCAPWAQEPDLELMAELEVQALDDHDAFDTDDEAHLHVLGRAIDGHIAHEAVLIVLAEDNPTELARILSLRDDH